MRVRRMKYQFLIRTSRSLVQDDDVGISRRLRCARTPPMRRGGVQTSFASQDPLSLPSEGFWHSMWWGVLPKKSPDLKMFLWHISDTRHCLSPRHSWNKVAVCLMKGLSWPWNRPSPSPSPSPPSRPKEWKSEVLADIFTTNQFISLTCKPF